MFFSNAVFITNSLPWNIVIVIALVAVAAVVGALVAHTHDVKNAESKVSQAEQTVRTMIEDAIKKAETIKKETIIEAREEALRLKTEQEREEKERRSELQRSERRLQQREESLDKKQDSLEQREQALAKRVKAAEAKEASIDALYEQQRAELERIAGMTPEESSRYYFDHSPQELFDVKETRIPLPVKARIFESYNCESCGEKTGANWIRLVGGKKLCMDCYESYNRFDV